MELIMAIGAWKLMSMYRNRNVPKVIKPSNGLSFSERLGLAIGTAIGIMINS